jgi:uncharacterized coiled-coil protein SlyX
MTWQIIVTILEVGGWVLAGALGLVGVFDSSSRKRRKEDDDTASNLITNLRTTTDLQEKELTALRLREVDQGRDIAHLQGQVKVLTEILQGRDPAMKAFLDHAPLLIDIAKENNGLAKEQAKATTELTNSLTALIQAMGTSPK